MTVNFFEYFCISFLASSKLFSKMAFPFVGSKELGGIKGAADLITGSAHFDFSKFSWTAREICAICIDYFSV